MSNAALVDGAKIQRTSRKGRTQAYDRTFTHQEGVPAGWNKKSVISVVLTEHETLAGQSRENLPLLNNDKGFNWVLI